MRAASKRATHAARDASPAAQPSPEPVHARPENVIPISMATMERQILEDPRRLEEAFRALEAIASVLRHMPLGSRARVQLEMTSGDFHLAQVVLEPPIPPHRSSADQAADLSAATIGRKGS